MTNARLTSDSQDRSADAPRAGLIAETPEDFRTALVHELVQPLTAISGRVQFAKRLLKADPDRAGLALDDACEQIARIDGRLAELREHARETPTRPAVPRTAAEPGRRS